MDTLGLLQNTPPNNRDSTGGGGGGGGLTLSQRSAVRGTGREDRDTFPWRTVKSLPGPRVERAFLCPKWVGNNTILL